MGKEKLNDVKYHLDHFYCTFYPYLELDCPSMQFYSYRKEQLGRIKISSFAFKSYKEERKSYAFEKCAYSI